MDISLAKNRKKSILKRYCLKLNYGTKKTFLDFSITFRDTVGLKIVWNKRLNYFLELVNESVGDEEGPDR